MSGFPGTAVPRLAVRVGLVSTRPTATAAPVGLVKARPIYFQANGKPDDLSSCWQRGSRLKPTELFRRPHALLARLTDHPLRSPYTLTTHARDLLTLSASPAGGEGRFALRGELSCWHLLRARREPKSKTWSHFSKMTFRGTLGPPVRGRPFEELRFEKFLRREVELVLARGVDRIALLCGDVD